MVGHINVGKKREKLATTKVFRIVDANTKSVNSCEAQFERTRRKIKRAKHIRLEVLQGLKNETKETKATDVIAAGDFNEEVSAKKIHEFIVETGLHELFS